MTTTDAERWRVALHECGHGVAALRLLGVASVRMIVFRASDGYAGLCNTGQSRSEESEPTTWRSALVTACGPAAERIAWSTSAPIIKPAQPIQHIETIVPDLTASLTSQIESGVHPSDRDAVRRWATREGIGPVGWRDHRTWKQRIVNVRWQARAFVKEHHAEILEAAEQLYRCGEITLQVEGIEE